MHSCVCAGLRPWPPHGIGASMRFICSWRGVALRGVAWRSVALCCVALRARVTSVAASLCAVRLLGSSQPQGQDHRLAHRWVAGEGPALLQVKTMCGGLLLALCGCTRCGLLVGVGSLCRPCGRTGAGAAWMPDLRRCPPALVRPANAPPRLFCCACRHHHCGDRPAGAWGRAWDWGTVLRMHTQQLLRGVAE